MIILNQDCTRCNQPIDLAERYPVDSSRLRMGIQHIPSSTRPQTQFCSLINGTIGMPLKILTVTRFIYLQNRLSVHCMTANGAWMQSKIYRVKNGVLSDVIFWEINTTNPFWYRIGVG